MIQDKINEGFVRVVPEIKGCKCGRGIVEKGKETCRICQSEGVKRKHEIVTRRSASDAIEQELRLAAQERKAHVKKLLLTQELPEDAKVTQSGRQFSVAIPGMPSITLHLNEVEMKGYGAKLN